MFRCFFPAALLLSTWASAGEFASPSVVGHPDGTPRIWEPDALPELGPDHADGYRVGPGDVLQVIVVGESELTKAFTVSHDGALTLPYVGHVSVEGLSVDEIGASLVEHFSHGWLNNPQIAASVSVYVAHKVVVQGGDVKNPGMYALTGATSVLEMLSIAGGVAQGSASRQVDLSRPNGEVISLDMGDLVAGVVADILLVGGDRLNVREGHVVYVAGQVNKEQSLPFVDGMTVLQALRQAGGAAETARLRGAFVLRGDERILVNLRRVESGKDSDFAMRPGDQLIVPESLL